MNKSHRLMHLASMLMVLLCACGVKVRTTGEATTASTTAPESEVRADPKIRIAHTYEIAGQRDYIQVSEWTDSAGRFCTHTLIRGGREQALDCDWRVPVADAVEGDPP